MEATIDTDVQRILLATDFSRWTEYAVEFAFQLAGCFGAELLMVHAVEPIADAAVDDTDDGEFEDFFGDLIDKSKRELETLVEEAERRKIGARFHIEIGERWRIIIDHAEQENVDLIVLGRRTYKDHRDLSLGTTSQRVYFSTDRPVLTVPGKSNAVPDDGEPGDDPEETT